MQVEVKKNLIFYLQKNKTFEKQNFIKKAMIAILFYKLFYKLKYSTAYLLHFIDAKKKKSGHSLFLSLLFPLSLQLEINFRLFRLLNAGFNKMLQIKIILGYCINNIKNFS